MIKKILPFLCVASLLLCAATPAQSPTLVVNNMEIDIWPEYDQPSTLIIYRVSFTSLTSFPTRVGFRIPASAGDPYSVAMKDLDGLLYDLQYSVIPDGDWNRIEFITSTPDVQIEFYDAIKQEPTGDHSYAFRWNSDYSINNLKMVAQQPRYATGMTLVPSFGKGVLNKDDGLTYFTTYVGAVNLGESINVNLDYQKTNNQLSASTLPVKAVNAQPQSASLWQTLSALFLPVWENRSLLTAGYFLIVGILFVLVVMLLSSHKRRRLMETISDPARTVRKANPVRTADSADEVYCHVCGKRARPGDLYCRACGSKLLQK